MSAIYIEDFRPVIKPPLRGFARIRTAKGLVISGVVICQQGERFWAGMPGIPQYGRDGQPVLKKNGKQNFTSVISFEPKSLGEQFSQAIISAMREQHPDAFEGAEESR